MLTVRPDVADKVAEVFLCRREIVLRYVDVAPRRKQKVHAADLHRGRNRIGQCNVLVFLLLEVHSVSPNPSPASDFYCSAVFSFLVVPVLLKSLK